MTTIPQIQKAWRIMRKGLPAHALELRVDAPVLSKLEEGETLVQIKSAALNPVGYKLMKMLPGFMAVRPLTAEYDFSGVVVDQKGTTFTIGDEVFGQMPARGYPAAKGQGALAQYISISSKHLARKPPSMSFVEAAGLMLAGRTAVDGLVDVAQIKEGQSVFVNGGTSAVGIYGIQIAKAYGCKVTASCSTKNIELVKSLGADEVIDYTVKRPEDLFRESPPSPLFDVIFDAVGMSSGLYGNSESYMKSDGLFVSPVPGGGLGGDVGLWSILSTMKVLLLPGFLGGVRRRNQGCAMQKDGRATPTLEKLVTEGKIKPVIDSTYAFEDVLKAYERMMSGRCVGKVVVTIDV